MAAVAPNDTTELACVMIPLGSTQLLLPNVSVAEIIPWRRLKQWDDAPAWCAGLLGWRGEAVPVLDYDAMSSEGAKTASRGRCLLVMNRARSSVGRPFYALAAAGLPRLVHLRAEDMESHAAQLGPAEVASVMVGTELAVVPNLSFIEEQLAGLPEFRLRSR
jgi:chemosensory pili system protein ChpC